MSAPPQTPAGPKLLRKGQFLMREGEMGNLAYLIQRGSVEVFVKRDEQRIQLATLGANEIVGEMALIDRLPRSANVVAIEDTVIIPIDLSKLRLIMQTQPDLALLIIRVLVRKIRDINKLVTSGGRKSELEFWYRICTVAEQWGILMNHLPEGNPSARPLPEIISKVMSMPIGEAMRIINVLKQAGLAVNAGRCFGTEIIQDRLSLFLRTYEKQFRDDSTEKQQDPTQIEALVSNVIVDLVAKQEALPGGNAGQVVNPAFGAAARVVKLANLLKTLLSAPILMDFGHQEREALIRSALLRLQRSGLIERDPPTSEEVTLHVSGLMEKAKVADSVPAEFNEIKQILLSSSSNK